MPTFFHHPTHRLIKRGFPVPYLQALSSGCIERSIRPVVIALNSFPQVATLASCEGHRRRFTFSWPYVALEAPLAFASALSLSLQADSRQKAPRLSLIWQVEPLFDHYGLLVFRLAPQSRQPRCWSRTPIDHDLAILTDLILDLK